MTKTIQLFDSKKSSASRTNRTEITPVCNRRFSERRSDLRKVSVRLEELRGGAPGTEELRGYSGYSEDRIQNCRDEPIVRYEGSTPIYYHANSLGSVVALTDEDGELLETVEYDVYGAPAVTQEEGVSPTGNRFLFTGREWDSETGLYHYRARAYSPSLGRFLQRDPVGLDALLNLYAYLENNPTGRTDPLGLGKDWMEAGFFVLPLGAECKGEWTLIRSHLAGGHAVEGDIVYTCLVTAKCECPAEPFEKEAPLVAGAFYWYRGKGGLVRGGEFPQSLCANPGLPVSLWHQDMLPKLKRNYTKK